MNEKNSNMGMKPVLIVTGGSRGIGAAVCRKAASLGYAVAFSFLTNKAAARALQQELQTSGAECLALQSDVAKEKDVLKLFDAAEEALGPIKALVNNAGVLETQMPLVDMTVERIDRVMATNVRGSLLCAREAVRRMAVSRGGAGGCIVNLSSRAAVLGAANEYIDYAVSKGAIDTLTVGLSQEVGGDGIRVNAVRPGLIETDIHASGGEPGRVARLGSSTPMGRGGSADEVADTIIWLLSEKSSYCNGALLDVSGGR